jgi:hypothetical protein
VHLGDTPSSLTLEDYKYLGERTEGFSGSDVATMVKDVLFEPLRKTQVTTERARTQANGHHNVGICIQSWGMSRR